MNPAGAGAVRPSRRSFLQTSAAAAASLLAPPMLAAVDQPASFSDFSSIRGINYYPSWTRSLPDLWTEYDPERVRFELSLARSLNANAIRVWLGTEPWERSEKVMLDRVEDFLSACQDQHLQVLPVVFDSCGVEPSDYSGEIVTLPQAYERLMRSPQVNQASRAFVQTLAGKYVNSAGRNALCPYSESDPSTLLWQWHAPSPGYSKLTENYWTKYESYLTAVLRRFDSHPAILAWDLFNEPRCIRILSRSEAGGAAFDWQRVSRFIAHMRTVAASLSPLKPITFGAESTATMRDLAEYAPLLSFHTYEADPQKLRVLLSETAAFASAQKKPVLLSETLSVLFLNRTSDSDDATQLQLYRSTLPVIEAAGMGYFAVAVMEGRFPFSWVGMFRPDGTRKPVADYVESVWSKLPPKAPLPDKALRKQRLRFGNCTEEEGEREGKRAREGDDLGRATNG